jgi:adenylate cyclase
MRGRSQEIPIADAIDLQQTAMYRLSKVRHEIKVGDQLWTVDKFEGNHDGLVIAEIKLADIPVLPDWLWLEVTGDPQYSNVRLAQS